MEGKEVCLWKGKEGRRTPNGAFSASNLPECSSLQHHLFSSLLGKQKLFFYTTVGRYRPPCKKGIFDPLPIDRLFFGITCTYIYEKYLHSLLVFDGCET